MTAGRLSRSDAARRATRVQWAISLTALLMVVTAVILLGRDDSGGVAYAGDLRPGGKLESLRLPALNGQGSVDYADFSDRPLVINFFASGCPSCVSELPAFEQVHRQQADQVGFLGISQRDSRDASIELARQTGITYPTGFDPVGSFFDATGAIGMPTTIFVRPGGEIADVWVGPLDGASLESLIAEHFGT